MRRKRHLAVILFFALLVSAASDARCARFGIPILEGKPWHTSDMRPTGPGTFSVEGADPYIFSDPVKMPLRDIKGLYWNLRVIGANAPFSMQLFLGIDELGWSEYLSFRFRPDPFSGFFIPFPFHAVPEALGRDAVLKTVRLDLDNCRNCRLELEGIERVEQLSEGLTALIPPDMKYPVIPQPAAPDITQKGPWGLHGIRRLSDTVFELGADDPYLRSPNLDISLTHVKGVHLLLRFSASARKRMMQLFWDTYSTGFQEKNSIRFLADLKNGVADVYLPLPEFERNDLLKSIRLDIYGIPGERFHVLATRVIADPASIPLDRVPTQIMYPPGENVELSAVVTASLRRLAIDKYFFSGYVIFLLSIVLAMAWLKKKEA
jgi:hypothetical protein